MKNKSCIVERFEPATEEETREGLAGRLLAQKGVAVLATGADSCTRMVYNAAAVLGAEDRFFHCSLAREDYVLGAAEEKIRSRLNEILRIPNVTAVVIYASCMDVLTGLDFEAMIERLDNERGIPVKAFLRGPLVQRTHKPREALQRILAELPEPVGEIRQGNRRFPPLLPDFNSVGAILQDWDLHNFMATAGGCPGCMIELPDHPAYRLHKSRLDDVQVALGCDALLKNAVAEDAPAAKQKTTALLSGAALTMAGFDYDGLTKELINEGVNCVLLPANGFDPGPVGATEAFLRLGQTMIKESPKQPDRVNILGYDPMVFLSESKISHGIEHMDRRALDCYILGSRGEEDVQRASGAALNWVVSAEGLPLARYMELCFGVPMLCGIPIGKHAMLHWRKRVNELTGRDDEEIELPQPAAPCGCQPRIVLIGEPMLTKSMAASLENDLGLKRTERFVYDPHGALRQLYEKEFPEVSYFSEEEELNELLRDADAWIADPVYKESVPDVKALFIPIPDPLLSGMKYADLPYDIFGKKGGMYLANALKDLIKC